MRLKKLVKRIRFEVVIALIAVFIGLVFAFNLLLGPIKKDIEHLRAGQAELKQMIKNHSHNPPKQAKK